jgi:hypothetical protein
MSKTSSSWGVKLKFPPTVKKYMKGRLKKGALSTADGGKQTAREESFMENF